MTNPLLDCSDLPAFDEIRPEHVTPAIDVLLADADAALERVVGPDVPPDFDAMSAVFTVATERLARAWRAVEHLTGVADTPELRAAYAENLPRDHRVLHAPGRRRAPVRQVPGASPPAPTPARLSPVRRKALANWLRDFKLGGADLRGAAEGALRGHPGTPGRAVAPVLRARARCHRRLRAVRARDRTRRRARGRDRGGARGRARPTAARAASSRCTSRATCR